MPDPDDSQRIKGGRVAALGSEFGVSVVAGVVLGYYLDLWLGTGPLFILVVSLGAFAGAIYRMVTMLKRYK